MNTIDKPKPFRISDDKIEIIIVLIEKGDTKRHIAKQLGICSRTVQRVLDELWEGDYGE